MRTVARAACLAATLALLSGCVQMPTDGPASCAFLVSETTSRSAYSAVPVGRSAASVDLPPGGLRG